MSAKKRDKAVSDSEHEQARTALLLSRVPAEILSLLSVKLIRQLYHIRLSHGTVWQLKQTIIDSREGITMEGSTRTSKLKAKLNPATASGKQIRPKKISPEEVDAQVVLERLARIVTKTYPHLGDDELVASEDALRMIYRELGHFDPAILKRNEKRALPKQTPLTNI